VEKTRTAALIEEGLIEGKKKPLEADPLTRKLSLPGRIGRWGWGTKTLADKRRTTEWEKGETETRQKWRELLSNTSEKRTSLRRKRRKIW